MGLTREKSEKQPGIYHELVLFFKGICRFYLKIFSSWERKGLEESRIGKTRKDIVISGSRENNYF